MVLIHDEFYYEAFIHIQFGLGNLIRWSILGQFLQSCCSISFAPRMVRKPILSISGIHRCLTYSISGRMHLTALDQICN